uniref:Uncharacterized protein n=1 Tax=Cacopsylla melanoneura TaxID=428564 RepID=A0A8D8Z8T5_9HEMI
MNLTSSPPSHYVILLVPDNMIKTNSLETCWLLLAGIELTVYGFHTQYSSSSGYSHVKVENDRDGYSYETKVFHHSPPYGGDHSFYARSLDSLGEDAYYRYAPHFYSSLDYHILDLDIDLLELELDTDLDLDLDHYLSLYGLNYLGRSRHFWRTGKHIPLTFGHLYGLGSTHLGPSFGLEFGLGYSLGYGYDKYGLEEDIEDELDDIGQTGFGLGLGLGHHFDSDLSDEDDVSDHDVAGKLFGWFKR